MLVCFRTKTSKAPLPLTAPPQEARREESIGLPLPSVASRRDLKRVRRALVNYSARPARPEGQQHRRDRELRGGGEQYGPLRQGAQMLEGRLEPQGSAPAGKESLLYVPDVIEIEPPAVCSAEEGLLEQRSPLLDEPSLPAHGGGPGRRSINVPSGPSWRVRLDVPALTLEPFLSEERYRESQSLLRRVGAPYEGYSIGAARLDALPADRTGPPAPVRARIEHWQHQFQVAETVGELRAIVAEQTCIPYEKVRLDYHLEDDLAAHKRSGKDGRPGGTELHYEGRRQRSAVEEHACVGQALALQQDHPEAAAEEAENEGADPSLDWTCVSRHYRRFLPVALKDDLTRLEDLAFLEAEKDRTGHVLLSAAWNTDLALAELAEGRLQDEVGSSEDPDYDDGEQAEPSSDSEARLSASTQDSIPSYSGSERDSSASQELLRPGAPPPESRLQTQDLLADRSHGAIGSSFSLKLVNDPDLNGGATHELQPGTQMTQMAANNAQHREIRPLSDAPWRSSQKPEYRPSRSCRKRSKIRGSRSRRSRSRSRSNFRRCRSRMLGSSNCDFLPDRE